jgi:hypothetical protein
MRVVLPLLLAVLISTAAAHAATFLIDPAGTGDFPTIQAALDAAGNGDTILLADGVFAGAGNRDLDFLGKAVTVRSVADDPAACVLECGGSATEPHRGVLFRTGEDSTAVLAGVTIRGGWFETGPAGGAIACVQGSSPAVARCVFTANRDAAVACFGGASPRFTECVFRGNGGPRAGAVYAEQYCAPVFRACRFEANRSPGSGAGTFCNFCRPRFEDCLFTGNVGTGMGALHFLAFVEATLTGCTFAGNSCAVTGTVYAGKMSTTAIDRCTFWGNDTPNGAAVKCDGDCPTALTRTLIAFGTSGSAIASENAGAISLACCDLYGNAGGDWVGSIADQLGVNGNIAADPLLCDPANGDFTLRADSPCAPLNSVCGGIGAWPVGCEASQACDPARATPGRLLGRVAPDPAVGPVTIRCALPAGPSVSLDVLDSAGRRVRALADGPVRAVVWDRADDRGRPLASGVYFVRLRVNGRTEVRPLLVIR